MAVTRYALYCLPPADAGWARLATAWLGWDIESGETVARPPVPGLPLSGITRSPRRYGLHATLKPPFRLIEGQDRTALEAACAALCAGMRPVRMQALSLARMGGFLALRAVGPEATLNALAADCLRGLDRIRAPMTDEERALRAIGCKAGSGGQSGDLGLSVRDGRLAVSHHPERTGRAGGPRRHRGGVGAAAAGPV